MRLRRLLPVAVAALGLLALAACSGGDDVSFIIQDADRDGIADDLDTDDDGDTVLDDGALDGATYTPCAGGAVLNCDDNCRRTPNADQADGDGDRFGDRCDTCPSLANTHAAPEDCNADGDTLDPGEGADAQCDRDDDRLGDDCDLCPDVADPQQGDQDGDTVGDACEDSDGDTLFDLVDNCPNLTNVNAAATDCNADGDTADAGEAAGAQCNQDGDRPGDACDNCPAVPNSDQANSDANPAGDACSDDDDGDTILDNGDMTTAYVPCSAGMLTNCDDNCRTVANPAQDDGDSDDLGDACDNCPAIANVNAAATNCDNDTTTGEPGELAGEQCDVDGDGVGDACDNCTDDPNTSQDNGDTDPLGAACDNCPTVDNPGQADTDPGTPDGFGDDCDNCPALGNPLADCDGDTVIDATQCDADADGVGDACDLCPAVADPGQADTDGDLCGDACDPAPADPAIAC